MNQDPEFIEPIGDGDDPGGGEVNPLDDLGLSDNGDGDGDNDPSNNPDDDRLSKLEDTVNNLTAELEKANQRVTTAEGRLRAERSRSKTSFDNNENFDESELSDEARIVLKRQLAQERVMEARWKRQEDLNALERQGFSYEDAELIHDLENSGDADDYVKAQQMRYELTDSKQRQQRDELRKQQLADRNNKPETTGGGNNKPRSIGHSPRTVAKSIIDNKIDIVSKIQEIAGVYGESVAESVMNEYENYVAEGYVGTSG